MLTFKEICVSSSEAQAELETVVHKVPDNKIAELACAFAAHTLDVAGPDGEYLRQLISPTTPITEQDVYSAAVIGHRAKTYQGCNACHAVNKAAHCRIAVGRARRLMYVFAAAEQSLDARYFGHDTHIQASCAVLAEIRWQVATAAAFLN